MNWGKGNLPHEPVAAGNDGGVGTFRVGEGEEALRLVDRLLVSPLGEGVGCKVSRVWAADSLDPDVGEFILKGTRKRRPNDGALQRC